MYKQVTAIKARQNLGELLEEVYYKNDHFLITRRKKAMAVVIPVAEYESFLKQRQEDFAVLDEIRALQKRRKPAVVEREVAEALRRVRAKKRAHREKSRS